MLGALQFRSNIPIVDELLNGFNSTDVVMVVGSSLCGKTSFCKLFTHQEDASRILWYSSIPRSRNNYVDNIDDLIECLTFTENPLEYSILIIDNLTHLLDANPNMRLQDTLNSLLTQISRFENALCICTSLRDYPVRFASIILRLYNTKTALTIKLISSYRHYTPREAILPKIG